MHKAIRHQWKIKSHTGITPHHIRTLLFLFALVTLTLALAALCGQCNNVQALSSEESNNNFSVEVDLSLNITLSSDIISLPIVPKENGQFGRTFINVWADTNNVTGYNLTMQASGDTLTNTKQTDPAYTIDPLTQQVSCNDESDDTCTGFPVNQWGYRIGSTGAYLPASNITDAPIQLSHAHTYTTDTDPVATIYFGAKVDQTKPAGIYDGVKLTFTATSNVTSATAFIKPDSTNGVTKVTLNGEECIDDAGCLVDGLTPWESYDLIAEVGEGYTFSVWNVDGKGEVTDPNAASTQFTVGNGDVTITAIGKVAGMQGMNSCPSGVTTATDTRDGNTYAVGIVNGKCWMLENLRLGSKGPATITSDNTNIKSTTTTINGSSKTQKTGQFDMPGSTSSGFGVYDYPQINTSKVTSTGGGYSGATYGVYYNYCAATAGTYCASNGSGRSNASSDICPKGWRLPTKAEFDSLVSAYSDALGLYNTLRLPFSGRFYGSSAGYPDSNATGFFWASTYYDGNNMYILYIGSSFKYTDYSNRSVGHSVRCVLGS